MPKDASLGLALDDERKLCVLRPEDAAAPGEGGEPRHADPVVANFLRQRLVARDGESRGLQLRQKPAVSEIADHVLVELADAVELLEQVEDDVRVPARSASRIGLSRTARP
ncbi:MAG: hypothetical protein R2712_03400 [Vicinamibacterales bacterium]